MSLAKVSGLPASWNDPAIGAAEASALLAQPHHHLWVIADENPHAPHYAHLLARVVEGEAADILTLFTHAELRRKGYARRLLAALIAFAHQNRCPCITLEVRASNAAAIGLYGACGFTPRHTRKGYYGNPREDALVLTLDLPH